MTTHFEDIIRQNSQRLADLKKTTEDLQRELSEARVSLERQRSQTPHGHDLMQEQLPDLYLELPEESPAGPDADSIRGHYPANSQVYYSADEPPFVGEGPRYENGAEAGPADVPDPTVGIVNHGRQSAYRRGLSQRATIAITGAAVVLATVLAVIISSGGPSWPASVATVQAEITKACQNPDVVSEPGQVNFACAKATRQVLWVFALLTSGNDPRFEDTKTGRQGLEPITPAQGGEVAASLNLHHPYDPADPIDSIAVAARAINDIIGGATLTGTDGNPVVQSGLEGSSRNCLRYTGSGLVTSRQGFPDVCTHRITSAEGQSALVADVYRKWILGTSTGAAHDAAVLFTNAGNPGDPQVQAILKQLDHETLAA